MFRFLLNLLLPQPPRVAALEKMTAAEFRAAVPALPAQPREWMLPLFPYENPLVKTAVWEVKYRGNARVARLLGELLAEELTGWLAELPETEGVCAPLLVPIPLAKKRQRERGFNQSELLAKEMTRLCAGVIELKTDALFKTKETESQTQSKNRESRINNLNGCFAVKNPEEVKGRNIVLVDDVATTGATLAEARKALLAAGARKVFAVTVAH